MATTIAILAALAVTVLAAVLVWIGTRRTAVGPLDGVTVSRQWLLQHQTDDHRP